MKKLIFYNFRYYLIRLIGLLTLLYVIYLSYFYYHPSVEAFGYVFINPYYQYTKYLELWRYFLIFMTAISIISFNVFFLLTLYFTYARAKSDKKRQQLESDYSEKIVSFIYSDFLSGGKSPEDFYQYFKKSTTSWLAQEMLLRVIIKTQNLVEENFRTRFTELIVHLKLQKTIKRLFYSKNISRNIIALKVISHLKITGYANDIVRYTKSNNYALRNEATTALLRLTEITNLDKLLSNQQHLSKLSINTILSTLDHNLTDDDIDFVSLLKSQKVRVAVIGVLLVKNRRKSEYKDLIKSNLNREDDFLREVAWEVYASFANSDLDYEFMLQRFDKETYKNKLMIVKSLKNFENKRKLFAFLDNVVRKEHLILKVQALKILFENNFYRLLPYKVADNKNVASAYHEVVDLYLS